VALPPSAQISEYARAAEGAGCARLWLFDSPALYGDIWIAAARVADATAELGIGTGVAVPSLRHPMVTASAIATIEEQAPGRLTCAFGTGHTARRAMGRSRCGGRRWAPSSGSFVGCSRATSSTSTEHPARCCTSRTGRRSSTPHTAVVGAQRSEGNGGRRRRRRRRCAVEPAAAQPLDGQRPAAVIVSGTVLRPGEDHTTARVFEAAGPWYAAMWHAVYEMAPDFVTELPGGATWLKGLRAARPDGQLHLGVHEGHVCALTDRDRTALQEAGAGILEYGMDWAAGENSCSGCQLRGIGNHRDRLYASWSRHRRGNRVFRRRVSRTGLNQVAQDWAAKSKA